MIVWKYDNLCTLYIMPVKLLLKVWQFMYAYMYTTKSLIQNIFYKITHFIV